MTIKKILKSGGLRSINHNRMGLAVKTAVKAGGREMNHNQSACKA